ncbi:MAG: DoxX family protein [Chitinophagaceae bacterium]
MTIKTTKAIYWISAALISLWFGASGFFDLTTNPIVWEITVQLGYPAHFIYILGVAKLTGIVVLLTPNKFLRLKEWVFAGIFFDIIFAFFSKLAVLGVAATGDAVIAFIIASTAYLMFRKLYPANYGKLQEGKRVITNSGVARTA